MTFLDGPVVLSNDFIYTFIQMLINSPDLCSLYNVYIFSVNPLAFLSTV